MTIVTFIVLLSLKTQVLAASQTTIVLINQVRGTECCDPGSTARLQETVAELDRHDLRATFAFRYDALRDPAFTTLIQGTPHEPALFLEITPNLARDAGASYDGKSERWYKAKRAYLLGYPWEERKKILDTQFATFLDTFGAYPTTTVAWMIDAQSLSYIHEQYGVNVHELTREQWGTDSYTLYGGPVNTPYFPSKKWPLIPAAGKGNQLDLLIIRQTLTDPALSYGDGDAVYTSQPNDYQKRGLGMPYFQKLIQALELQYPMGFGVIGLENSMPLESHREFYRQIADLASRSSADFRILPARELRSVIPPQNPPISLFRSPLSKPDGVDGFWIGTSAYRIRLLAHQERVIIDDFRVYADHLEDPYAAVGSHRENAYWIVPFFLDASRYAKKQEVSTETRSLSALLTQEKSVAHITQDALHFPDSGIELPPKGPQPLRVETNREIIRISYQAKKGGEVALSFSPTSFSLSVPQDTQLYYTAVQADLEALQRTDLFSWGRTTEGNLTTFTPKVAKNASMSALINQFPDQLQPEKSSGAPSQKHTQILLANHFAILGKNPIRLVLYARDDRGQPTLLSTDPSIRDHPQIASVSTMHPEGSIGEYYIDVFGKQPGSLTLDVHADGIQQTTQEVTFLPDCTASLISCLRSPQFLFQFLLMKIEQRWTGRT